MRRVTGWLATILLLAALVLAGSLATARSGQPAATPGAHHHGEMSATPGHGGPMAGSTGNGVVYLTITNDGDEDDALVGGTTDRAERVELHETRMENEIAGMQPVEGPLPIPVGETVSLEPGGLHLMLVNLTDDIMAGDVFELTLTFERAGEVTIQVPARLDAEPGENEIASETVEAGDLTLEGMWSRPAPRLTSGAPPATPEASPAA